MAEKTEQLELKFTPSTIEHLGIKMYSQLRYGLAELVANAYDADAENVYIYLEDTVPGNWYIAVKDDGSGMSFDEVQDNFLVIGRKRRDSDVSRLSDKRRRITGRKGLGKLALFGIGKNIEIETEKAGESDKLYFTLNWDKIMDWDKLKEESLANYRPQYHVEDKKDLSEHGTTIIVSDLTRKTKFGDSTEIAASLAKLFNCFDKNFKVFLILNGGEPVQLTRNMIYENINQQFSWDVPNLVAQHFADNPYAHKNGLRGCIISSQLPLKGELRGITLYVNGRLANLPGFFGVKQAQFAYTYLTGWIEADFIDEFSDQDLIATDRQSLSWDMPEAEKLQDFLQKMVNFIARDWEKKRSTAKKARLSSKIEAIDMADWRSKIPSEIQPKFDGMINYLEQKEQLNDSDINDFVRILHDILPEYTYYHYRGLHEEIQKTSFEAYKNGDFYKAFLAAMVCYKDAVRDKSEVSATEDMDIMIQSFGVKTKEKEQKKIRNLSVTELHKHRPCGKEFPGPTLMNIEEAQELLSKGVVAGGRNPVTHHQEKDLRASGLFIEKDCLDLLSLLSHLFRRLDDAAKVISKK